MPRPPMSEFQNIEALKTIQENPHLFHVSTPIHVDRFESLLASHPNQPFVKSVCVGLREGFWPFANTHYGEYPLTLDKSHRPPKTINERNFLHDQIQKEVEKNRYSPAFGPNLPGMYSMPIHAVPKPGTDKHRLVTDHSAGNFSLNSMIDRDDIAGVTLDNIQDLGNALRIFRDNDSDAPLHLWKADVSEAYRLIPMHPLWQIKQVVTFEGKRWLDWMNVFGGRASQRLFHAFMALVIWIAVTKLLLLVFIYVDDSFAYERANQVSFYKKYNKFVPRGLATMLRLWDFLKIPHEERKQVYGPVLPIIGFEVDPNLMSAKMSDESRLRLIKQINNFARHGNRRTLKDFQTLAGNLNWALNVYPLLRPGLSSLYSKISGKKHSKALIWINQSIVDDLHWTSDHLDHSDGVYFLKSENWDSRNLDKDDLEVYCDASGNGMGFWYPSLTLGFQSMIPPSTETDTIFFFEALAVYSALHDACPRVKKGARLAIYSLIVTIFNTLAAKPIYNDILKSGVDIALAYDIDFRVFHIPGVTNVIADHLSRFRNREAMRIVPGLVIESFRPPRDALGACKK
ncbi:hypothetical protein BJ138DRAFT_1138793 [Hygrophoropsis aurantiaca]|uniref:Uncharacterized protein n=1 Tax=Hygrophoropsis aurantiaca TaxID=72124 RepID=A0ACB7ZRY7_9AGAM|nr:hypothetical protein BJ138DRAFT_1138793 [Hygrophoropsis aurantiaca]